jgi:hypothetical protein
MNYLLGWFLGATVTLAIGGILIFAAFWIARGYNHPI